MSSYLGRGLEQVDNISKLDNLTFNGGTTYALTKDSAAFTPISSNALLVSIDGVIQQGNFSVSGTNIVFNFSPTGSNTCDFIMHYGTGVAFTPADSSITKDKANFISTSSAAGLQIKGDGTTDGTLQLNCSQNSHGVKIKSPAHSAGQSYTLTLPTTAPASNKMLQTDGSGNLSFVDAPSGDFSKIATITTDNSAVGNFTFDDCFTSSFTQYRIIGFVAPDTNNKPFGFEWRKTSGGSTSTHTGSDYIWTHFGHRIDNGGSTGSDIGGGFQETYAKIASHAVHLDSNSSTLSFDMVVTDPRETLLGRCSWHGTLTYTNPTSYRQFVGTFGGKMNGSISTITGVTFSFLAVNIKYGRITVYGMTQ